ncbi:unnamed protein product [Ectocarpus sp. 8 AP-2014]
MWAQGTLRRGCRPELLGWKYPGSGFLSSRRALPVTALVKLRNARRSSTTCAKETASAAAAAAAAGKGGGVKALLPHHLSPRWNERHDISIFGTHLCRMSLSEAAGHLSFVCLGIGFLETELLPLRVYAAAGVSASIVFQYYRPQPLWIPISWNFVFLAINVGMAGVLLKEERDATRQDQETAALYDKTFRESGLTAVDFMKIRGVSEDSRHTAAGDVLAEQDVKQKRLYLVMEGELQVSKGGNDIAPVKAGEFAGEMSFLRHVRRECEGSSGRGPAVCDCVAVANVQVKHGGAKVTSWQFDELRDLLAHNPNMSVRFHAALARAMVSKLVDTHNPAVKYRQLLTGVLVDGVVTTMEKDELEKMRQDMSVDEATHTAELKTAGWSTQEFDQGYQDDFSSRTYEALAKEVLRDGTVNDKGRAKLRIHRQNNGIDSLHHMRVLKKLGWSLDQLEEGTTASHRTPLSTTAPAGTQPST